MKKLRLLLPTGSLNTPGRGDTCKMMKKAGYDILDYEPGKEKASVRIANDPEISVMLCRPQSAPTELIQALGDVTICGLDWINETQGRNGSRIVEILDLEYGKTGLVFASAQSEKYENLDAFVASKAKAGKGILCYTEYLNTTAAALASCKSYKEFFGKKKPLKLGRSMSSGSNKAVRVIMSDGKTEAFIEKGADLIMDNTQTGRTLKEYNLQIIEKIGDSSARLCARVGASADSWLRGKIEELSRQLAGVIEGNERYYVVLNVPNDCLPGVMKYAFSKRLYSDEPSVLPGENFTQVSLLIPKAGWPKISRQLVELGARSILKFEPEQVLGGTVLNQRRTDQQYSPDNP